MFIIKHIRRNSNWVDCQTKNCNYGWLWSDIENGKTNINCKSKNKYKNKNGFKNENYNYNKKKQYQMKCKACNKTQIICKTNNIDNDFSSLLKSGEMRKCPKCEWPTMKDYGLCNIMHCGHCSIYWNWRTKEIANNSKELKYRARSNGTMWEPGELAYQSRLQRDNLPEFIKLLQRNGIKYDPNYRRGS